MIPLRDCLFACACTLASLGLVARASAGEVEGDLACYRKPTTVGFRSCYDPCEPVGPIRRFFRAVFRVPCPPPRVVVPVAMLPAACPPACPPACGSATPALPSTLPAAPPPVDVGRPVPVNPPINVPPPTPPTPMSGFGVRPQPQPVAPRSTLPTPLPTAVPLDRLASRSGQPVVRGVSADTRPALLLHTTQQGVRISAKVDADGRVLGEVPEGEWLIYTTDTGRYVYQGRIVSRLGVKVRAD